MPVMPGLPKRRLRSANNAAMTQATTPVKEPEDDDRADHGQ